METDTRLSPRIGNSENIPQYIHWNLRRIILNYVTDANEVIDITTKLDVLSWYQFAMPIRENEFHRKSFLGYACYSEDASLIEWCINNTGWPWDHLNDAIYILGSRLRSEKHVMLLLDLKKLSEIPHTETEDDVCDENDLIYDCSFNAMYSARRMFCDVFHNGWKDTLKILMKEFKINSTEIGTLANVVIKSKDLEFLKYLVSEHEFDKKMLYDSRDLLITFIKNDSEIREWIVKKFEISDYEVNILVMKHG